MLPRISKFAALAVIALGIPNAYAATFSVADGTPYNASYSTVKLTGTPAGYWAVCDAPVAAGSGNENFAYGTPSNVTVNNLIGETMWVEYDASSYVGVVDCSSSTKIVLYYTADASGIVTYQGPTPPPVGPSTPQISEFTVGTSSVHVAGYWTASSSIPATQYLEFWQQSPSYGAENDAVRLATTTGLFNFDFPIYADTGTYGASTSSITFSSGTTYFGRLVQLEGTFTPFFTGRDAGPNPLQGAIIDATSSAQSASSTVTWNTSSARSRNDLTVNCDFSNIGGCAQNVLVWSFYPSDTALSQFSGLTLRGKFPFEYIYDIQKVRDELFAASSTNGSSSIAVTLWKLPGQATTSITLASAALFAAVPFAGTVKGIIAALCWFLLANWVYWRVLKTHDTQTPS